jgi:uncharacterized membrane protein
VEFGKIVCLNNKKLMNQFNKNYTITILSGIISFLLIGVTYTKQPKDPSYAGSVFNHNMSFFFPLLILSILCLVICVVYLIRHIKDRKRQNEKLLKWEWIVPSILMLPVSLHILLILFNMIRF